MNRYLIYRTDFDNTIVRESDVDNPDTNEESLYTDFLIPDTQPLFLWRVNTDIDEVEVNIENNIDDWLDFIEPAPAKNDFVKYGKFSTYTGNTENNINDKLDVTSFNSYSGNTKTELDNINNNVDNISGVTDNKLDINDFNTYSGNTENNINDKLDVTSFNSYSGDTKTRIDDNYKYGAYGISTGIISGGTMTINSDDDSTFDIAPFVGVVVDQYTDPNNPTIDYIEYSGDTGITPSYLTQQQVTYISIDIDLNIQQSNDRPNPEDRRDFFYLGMIIHNNLTNINTINNSPRLTPDVAANTYDLINSIGMIKHGDFGNDLQHNGNSLSFVKTSGTVFKEGINYEQNNRNPNFKTFPEYNPVEFYYRRADGTVESTLLTSLIVDEYEDYDVDSNTSTIVKITGNTSQATVQRVYLFESGKVVVQRGQDVYNTMSNAINNLLNENFYTEYNIERDALLIGCIITRVDCADLSNRSRAAFISVDRYGSILGGGNTGFYEQTNYTLIRDVADFPEPDENNIINLYDNHIYHINGLIDIGDNTINIGQNCAIEAANPSNDIIHGSGNTLITGYDKSCVFQYIGLSNTVGDIFSLTGTTNSQFVIKNTYLGENSNVGNIYGYRFTLFDTVYFNYIDNGLELCGCDSTGDIPSDVYITSCNTYGQSQSGMTLFNIDDGYFDTIKFWDNNIHLSEGNTFLKVNHDNVSATGDTLTFGVINNNEFTLSSGSEVLSGITKATEGWFVKNNRGIEDSIILGFIEFVDNDTSTTIDNTDDYFKVEGTNNGITQGERMDVSVDNRILYDGYTPQVTTTILLSGNIYGNNNNQSILIGVYKNGTTLIGKSGVYIVREDEPVSFILNSIDTTNIDDYYEVVVRNTTSTVDVTVVDMQFKIIGEV